MLLLVRGPQIKILVLVHAEMILRQKEVKKGLSRRVSLLLHTKSVGPQISMRQLTRLSAYNKLYPIRKES